MTVLTACVLAATIAGQSSQPAPPDRAAPRPVALEGRVREVAGGPGGRPQALLVTEDAQQYRLHALDAGFRGELRRLAGLQVRIHGVLGDPRVARPETVLVDRYEILAVSRGKAPRIGRLAMLAVGDQKRLVFVDESGRADLLPRGWSRKLSRHAGAKVWMIGRHAKDGSFRPQRFSILRAAPKPETESSKP